MEVEILMVEVFLVEEHRNFFENININDFKIVKTPKKQCGFFNTLDINRKSFQ